MAEQGSTGITHVANVAVPVTDQDRALDFYTHVLGLEKVREFPMGDGKRWIEVAPPGATTTIALIAAGTPVGPRLTATDAEATHAELRARPHGGALLRKVPRHDHVGADEGHVRVEQAAEDRRAVAEREIRDDAERLAR